MSTLSFRCQLTSLSRTECSGRSKRPMATFTANTTKRVLCILLHAVLTSLSCLTSFSHTPFKTAVLPRVSNNKADKYFRRELYYLVIFNYILENTAKPGKVNDTKLGSRSLITCSFFSPPVTNNVAAWCVLFI